MSLVYRATNIVNGKFYIGVTKFTLAHRRNNHLAEARSARQTHMPFIKALRKYGHASFRWDILEEFDDDDIANAAEVAWIAALRPHYNVAKGGRGITGFKRSDEWKKMMSAKMKGRRRTPEQLEALRAAVAISSKKNWKPVVCLNDGNVFPAIKIAAEHYGIPATRVSCSATERECSAKGLYFSFVATTPPDPTAYQQIIEARKKRRINAIKETHSRRTAANYLQRRGTEIRIVEPVSPMPMPVPEYTEGDAEVWRVVPQCADAYEVSDRGRIRSVDRFVPCWSNDGTMWRRGKMLSPRPMSDGRLYVTIQKNRKAWVVAVSVLVASAFIRLPNAGEIVIRRNRDLRDDRPSNLFWGTPLDIANKRKLLGSEQRGERHANAKLSDSDVAIIRQQRGKIKQTELAKWFGVDRGQISSIQLGRSRVSAPVREEPNVCSK